MFKSLKNLFFKSGLEFLIETFVDKHVEKQTSKFGFPFKIQVTNIILHIVSEIRTKNPLLQLTEQAIKQATERTN